MYYFSGCKPKRVIPGIFGDPYARVIQLVRREKKLLVGYVALFIELIAPARSDWYATFPAGPPEFILNWKFGASNAAGAAR